MGGVYEKQVAGNENFLRSFSGKTSRRQFRSPTNGRESNMEIDCTSFIFDEQIDSSYDDEAAR